MNGMELLPESCGSCCGCCGYSCILKKAVLSVVFDISGALKLFLGSLLFLHVLDNPTWMYHFQLHMKTRDKLRFVHSIDWSPGSVEIFESNYGSPIEGAHQQIRFQI